MEYLNKLNRSDLEDIFSELMTDLKEVNPELADKYNCELEDYMYSMTIEEAQNIVRKMEPYGEKFTYDIVEQFLAEKGITEETDIIEYYLSMNMFYNDYKHIFDKYNNLNQKDIYYDFSEAFINDKDAPKYKVEKYFLLVK